MDEAHMYTPEESMLFSAYNPESLGGSLVMEEQVQQNRLHVLRVLHRRVEPDLELLLAEPNPDDVRPVELVYLLGLLVQGDASK